MRATRRTSIGHAHEAPGRAVGLPRRSGRPRARRGTRRPSPRTTSGFVDRPPPVGVVLRRPSTAGSTRYQASGSRLMIVLGRLGRLGEEEPVPPGARRTASSQRSRCSAIGMPSMHDQPRHAPWSTASRCATESRGRGRRRRTTRTRARSISAASVAPPSRAWSSRRRRAATRRSPGRSGQTTVKPASTSSGATRHQVVCVRGCPCSSSTTGPEPPTAHPQHGGPDVDPLQRRTRRRTPSARDTPAGTPPTPRRRAAAAAGRRGPRPLRRVLAQRQPRDERGAQPVHVEHVADPLQRPRLVGTSPSPARSTTRSVGVGRARRHRGLDVAQVVRRDRGERARARRATAAAARPGSRRARSRPAASPAARSRRSRPRPRCRPPRPARRTRAAAGTAAARPGPRPTTTT